MQKKIPKFYLKDRLFNPEKVSKLASEIASAYIRFDASGFQEDVIARFGELELKERITHITEMLARYLPTDYLEATDIILRALPLELDNTKTDGDYGDFIYAPYGEFIERYGSRREHLHHSLDMLEEITRRFSAEYPIRHFWNTYEDAVYEKNLTWAESPYYHVRRLASEGSRPRLPWGKKIGLHYSRAEIFLDELFSDRTRYVTRSVANHLNDISKVDPDFVLRKLSEWEKSSKQTPKEMDFIR